jgi:hypothetical protein
LTLLIYQQARRTKQAGWKRFTLYAAAMITMVLGLLTHENGLIIPLAMAGVEWLEYPPKTVFEAIKRPFLPYLLITPIFLFVWWVIPKTSEQILPSISSWFSNLVPFLQTLIYPLLPLFNLTAEDTAVLVVLAAVLLAITFLSAWLARARALWLFGLGWFLLSSLPATLFLAPDYLYGSPRLHYLPSAGVAMMLAMPVLALARRAPDRIWKRVVLLAVGLLYTLAIIIPPTAFISCELDFYEETSRIVHRMGEVGEEAPAGSSLLFVNVPIFFSSNTEHPQGCRNPYPWTPAGAVVMPAYASAKDFVRYNGGSRTLATAVSVAEYAPGWKTFGSAISPADLRRRLHVEQIHIFDLNLGDFYNLSATWLPGGAVDVNPLAVFGEGMRLNSATIGDPQQSEAMVTLVWQNRSGSMEGAAPTIFVHVYNQSGQLVAQHDGPPGSGFLPLNWWGEQDAIVDRHPIELPADLAPGQYNVAVGIYDPQTGERYTAVSADGTSLADGSLIIGQLALP